MAGVTVRGLDGDLTVPPHPRGVVLFAHGSGSSRHSPRNRMVAAVLADAGFAALLVDLLTVAEDTEVGRRFDIGLLADRLAGAADWLHRTTGRLPLGVFGASTGAAAALRLAADRPAEVRAVVSRGGRPDLAGDDTLRRVRAPTLLLVGGADETVLALNERAAAELPGTHRLVVVPGATHLFAEPGALERVAAEARGWFAEQLTMPDHADGLS
ncbi:MAG TPA: alpha/beta fold hydrolase [Actinocatenispora sp.]